LIIAKESTTKATISVRPRGGLAPHATPIISEPRLGKRNSALEMIASCLMDSDIFK